MTTKTETTTWVRYRHRKNPKIEYEVEGVDTGGAIFIVGYDGFYRIRTIRNLFYKEEIHIPSFTYMASEKFLSLYERV